MKICGVASSGGHFVELNYHLKALGLKDYFIISSENAQTKSNKKVKYFLKYNSRNPLNFLYNLICSFKIILHERPKLILSTGAGLAGIFCLIAKLFGSKIIHIETINRVTSNSTTGKFMYYIANEFIVLWPEQLSLYGKKAKYFGLPFMLKKSTKIAKIKKIFLTVGSTNYPFDRAIKYFDKVALQNKQLKFFAQIGTSNYLPKNMSYVRFLNYLDYQKTIKSNDLIICPPGAGTIIDSLEFGKNLQFIIRLKKYGEAIDDHQYELANKFKEYGIIINTLEGRAVIGSFLKRITFNSNNVFYKRLNDLM